MAATIVFQNNTVYNASATLLKGAEGSTATAQALIVQPTTADSYDGVMTLQFSPDGGTTWYALPMYEMTAAIGTAVYSVTAPVSTKIYIASVPSYVIVRVLMSGGTTGHLTVNGLFTTFLAL